MNDAPLPFCVECGDPRLSSWGTRDSHDIGAAWARYACGHRTYASTPHRGAHAAVAMVERASDVLQVSCEDLTGVALERAALDDLLRTVLEQERISQVELVLGEVIGSLVDGPSTGGPSFVRIALRVEADRVHVDVSGRRAPEVASPDEDGRFHIIEAFSDRWGIVEGFPPHVWFELDL